MEKSGENARGELEVGCGSRCEKIGGRVGQKWRERENWRREQQIMRDREK